MIAKNKTQQTFSPAELSRIIEMAWEDRTPFEAIEAQFNLSETDVIQLMRKSLRGGAFRLWRRRASGRAVGCPPGLLSKSVQEQKQIAHSPRSQKTA